jgi:hypothetical protein
MSEDFFIENGGVSSDGSVSLVQFNIAVPGMNVSLTLDDVDFRRLVAYVLELERELVSNGDH